MVLGIIIGVVVLLLLFFFATYNSLVTLRNRKDDQWAQIEVQLKRRADLIPNLVETVDVIKARNTYTAATTPEEEMKAAGEITKSLNKLFALAEAYPELKANENFMALQNDLKDTEDKISAARQFYNDTVLTYNNKVEMIPSNIVANIAGFKKAAFFEAGEAAKEAPKVEF